MLPRRPYRGMTTLDRLRQSASVGANRCLPCTAVNAVVAVALAAVAGLLWAPAAVAVLAVAAAAIYLRGYLVPGAPTLTERYLPDRALSWFGKGPDAAPAVAGEGVDPERVLRDAGVVVECADRDDLCLDDAFAAAWQDRMAAVDVDDERRRLADLLGHPETDLELEAFGGAFTARADGRCVGQWESRTAFRADAAAADLLAERLDRWPSLPVVARGELLGALRLFLDTCPACGGPVSLNRGVARPAAGR